MASIAVRAAASAAAALQAANLPFQHQTTQQFVVAALLGDGVSSFEEMTQLGIPLAIDKTLGDVANLGNVSGYGGPAWARIFRDDVVAKRMKKALGRAYARLDRPLPDAIDLTMLLMGATEIVKQHIREHGLFVDTQKLLFKPAFRQIAMRVLAEMKLPELPPVSASTAMAVGRLPRLPSWTLKEHLLYLGEKRYWSSFHINVGVNGPIVTFSDWVAANQPTLVEFPAPNIECGRTARTDEFSDHAIHPHAELGLGFFLVVTHKQIGERVQIVTPVLSVRQPADAPRRPWEPLFLSEQVNRSLQKHDAHKRLERAIDDIGRQSAHLKVCPTCREIYSDDREDLELRCDCKRATH